MSCIHLVVCYMVCSNYSFGLIPLMSTGMTAGVHSSKVVVVSCLHPQESVVRERKPSIYSFVEAGKEVS